MSYQNVDQIVRYLESIAPTKFDTVVPMSQLETVPLANRKGDHTIGLRVDRRTPIERIAGEPQSPALPMTDAAFRSMMYRMDLANGWKFMRDTVSPNFPEIGSSLLNAILRNEKFNSNSRGPMQAMVRSRGEIKDVAEPVHRAFFSEQYVALDMLNVARVVQNITNAFQAMENTDELMENMRRQYGVNVSIDNGSPGNGGISHVIERPNIGIDSMSFRVRWNMRFNTPELGPFYTGIFVKTDEIGGSSIHLLPYLYREVCKNGAVSSYERGELKMLRDAQGWAPVIPHRWGTVEDLEYKATQAVAFAAAYGTQLVTKAREAARRKIPNATEILGRMLESLVPKDVLQETTLMAGAGMEGESSVMGLVNGITAAAHNGNLSSDNIDELEAVGGTALRRYNERMSDDDITALFLGLAKAKLIEEENAV